MKSAPQKNDSTHTSNTPSSRRKGQESFFGERNYPFFNKNGQASAFLQPKLNINPPNDPYEREADAVADKVVEKQKTKPGTPSVPVQRQVEEETSIQEKPIADTITPLVQRQTEEETIQEKPIFETPSILEAQHEPAPDVPIQRREEKDIQAKSNDSATAPDPVSSLLQSSKGKGQPMPEQVLTPMESAFGSDFSNIRLHTDSDAVQMNQSLGAQAFTHGSDIYFNEGKYQPGSKEGDHLLAHELTHTVQQKGGDNIHTLPVQKKKSKKSNDQKENDVAPIVSKNTYQGKEGVISKVGGNTITIPDLPIPAFKAKYHPVENLRIRRGRPEGEKRATQQRSLWDQSAKSGSGLENKLNKKIKKAGAFGDPGNPIYYMRIGRSASKRSNYLVGTKKAIKDRLLRPYWTKKGKIHPFEVDHQREYQLNGEDRLSNLWLLERMANGSSGRNINSEIEIRVGKLLSASSGTAIWDDKDAPEYKEVKRNFDIVFRTVNPNLPVSAFNKNPADPESYTLKEIKEDALQLKHVYPLDINAVKKAGLQGSDTNLIIYNNSTGGRRFSIKLPNSKTGEVPFTDKSFIPGFHPTHADVTPDQPTIAVLKGRLNFLDPTIYAHDARVKFEIKKLEGVPHTGRLNVSQAILSIKNFFGADNIENVVFSPIRLTSITFDDQSRWEVRGKVITDIPIIDRANIDIIISSEEARLEKTFKSNEINIPGPINIKNSSLTISLGTRSGLRMKGQAGIEISKVAKGEISASAQTGIKNAQKAGFQVGGFLEFDNKIFKPARIKVAYKDRVLTIGGDIGVPEGKITGVKKATLGVSYSTDGKFSADGEAKLNVPGIDTVRLSASYQESKGFTFIGTVALKKMTGIKSGQVTVIVTTGGDDEETKLGVKGTAQPDLPNVPGLNVALTVSYFDGIFEVRTKVEYEKGRFKGTIEVGVTNRAVDEEGKPQGKEVSKPDEITIFGFGQLDVELFKGSKGVLKVRLTPAQEVLVGGGFILKDLMPFGKGKEIKKDLFKFPKIQIPVLGVPGVSVFFEISGGAHFYFLWKPLVLKELSITFKETNINELQTAQIEIKGSVGSMAKAEAFMRISMALGAEILVLEIKGGLSGEAGVGVTAEAGGAVDATWDHEKGIQFKEIRAYIHVTPKAFLRLKAFLSVDLDLWITSINLFYKDWVLAEGDLDLSALTLKLDFPIRFDEEGSVLPPSFDDLNIEQSDLAGAEGKDVMDQSVNKDKEKDQAEAKRKLQAEVREDIEEASEDDDFTPKAYVDEIMEDYGDDPKFRKVVENVVYAELQRIERKKFEGIKQLLRKSTGPLHTKLKILKFVRLAYRRIGESEYQAFENELRQKEQEKIEQSSTNNQDTVV